MSIDIKKERELLSTAAKRVWDAQCADIEDLCKKQGYTKEKTKLVKECYMTQIIYIDLADKNKYNEKSNDVLAKKDTKRNLVKMAKMKDEYVNYQKQVGKEYNKIKPEMKERQNTRIEKNNKKKGK